MHFFDGQTQKGIMVYLYIYNVISANLMVGSTCQQDVAFIFIQLLKAKWFQNETDHACHFYWKTTSKSSFRAAQLTQGQTAQLTQRGIR